MGRKNAASGAMAINHVASHCAHFGAWCVFIHKCTQYWRGVDTFALAPAPSRPLGLGPRGPFPIQAFTSLIPCAAAQDPLFPESLFLAIWRFGSGFLVVLSSYSEFWAWPPLFESLASLSEAKASEKNVLAFHP